MTKLTNAREFGGRDYGYRAKKGKRPAADARLREACMAAIEYIEADAVESREFTLALLRGALKAGR